jgi:hypothetical protein
MPPTAGAMKIERGVVYNPTIHHGYMLEKNRHPGRRHPWPLPPPICPPWPFRSRTRVDRAMGNAPYRRRHENLAGVDVLPNNPHLARHYSARLGSARLGSARLGSAWLGSARLGSARLGSAWWRDALLNEHRVLPSCRVPRAQVS